MRRLDDWARRVTSSDQQLSDGRQLLIRVLAVAALVVPAMVILLVQTVRAEQRDNAVRAHLERDGIVTAGTVAKVRSPLRWNVFPSTARIDFVTGEGNAVTTWVPVSHLPEKGARLDVRYVGSNPSMARLPGDETPNRGRWKLVAVGGPVFSIALITAFTLGERIQRRSNGRPSYWTGGGTDVPT
ncbi:MAG TPA: DUF3592 domain-containing protein [Actinomycetota bacterium]|nr:DUF3592 domain-containing protein [Actinomycetota bacterium]